MKTRSRVYGSDTDFSAWVRRHPELQYDYDGRFGLGLADWDAVFHRYMTASEINRPRDVQSLMYLEVKSRNGSLTSSQRDTLFKHHCHCFNMDQGKAQSRRINGQDILHFGVSILILSGTNPDNSASIKWGRFSKIGNVHFQKINSDQLIQLLRFDLHPSNLSTKPFRLHHKTREVAELILEPLGFVTMQKIVHRS